MDECLVLQIPDLDGHVIRAGGQEESTRIPLDRIHLVRVAYNRISRKVETVLSTEKLTWRLKVRQGLSWAT